MQQKITLPVSGLEVEVKALGFAESEKHLEAEAAARDAGSQLDGAYVQGFLTDVYGKELWAQVSQARPDVVELYRATIRYTFGGPEALKNSSGSGTGAPTQTD